MKISIITKAKKEKDLIAFRNEYNSKVIELEDKIAELEDRIIKVESSKGKGRLPPGLGPQ